MSHVKVVVSERILLLQYGHLLDVEKVQFGFAQEQRMLRMFFVLEEIVDHYICNVSMDGNQSLRCVVHLSKAYDDVSRSRLMYQFRRVRMWHRRGSRSPAHKSIRPRPQHHNTPPTFQTQSGKSSVSESISSQKIYTHALKPEGAWDP